MSFVRIDNVFKANSVTTKTTETDHLHGLYDNTQATFRYSQTYFIFLHIHIVLIYLRIWVIVQYGIKCNNSLFYYHRVINALKIDDISLIVFILR